MTRIKIDYGIDLGTTNSAISRMENGEPKIKKTDRSQDTLPSCVYINKKKAIQVGDSAYNAMKKDKLRAEINKILEEGEKLCQWSDLHEEWEIGDWEWDENIPEMFKIDIYDGVFSINDKLALIKDNIEPYEYKMNAFLTDDSYELNEAILKVRNDEIDIYENSTLEDVAMIIFDNYFGLDTDKTITRYLNFKDWGDDLQLDGYYQVGADVFFLEN